ncbi:MAG: hypothetical protein K2L22_04030, partial [Muribaculaceae bacterium]|nr:hypothetical protein [Muribaculaceae bacterium]
DFTEWEEIGNMIESYKGWAAQALAAANEEGQSFFFPFDAEEIDAYIAMMIMEATPAPTIPEKYDITLNGQTSIDLVETTQGYEQGVYTIKVSGMCLEKQLTVTLGVPEGWDGFVCMNEDDFYSDIEPLSTRAEETEWYPVEYMLLEGLKESNSMTFPVDGEDHNGQFYLVKDGLADVANHINIEFNVTDPTTVGVEGVEAIDANSDYYDLSGRKVAKPAAGMYIKVLNGKASKVIVK